MCPEDVARVDGVEAIAGASADLALLLSHSMFLCLGFLIHKMTVVAGPHQRGTGRHRACRRASKSAGVTISMACSDGLLIL